MPVPTVDDLPTYTEEPPFQNFGSYPPDRQRRDMRDFYIITRKRAVMIDQILADFESRIAALE